MSVMTRLEGVNWILMRCANYTTAALDSSGTWPTKTYNRSDAGDAEAVLDMACDEEIAGGLPSCKRYNVEFNLAAAGTINLGATAVQVQGVGKLARQDIRLIPSGGTMIATADGNSTFQPGLYTFDVWDRRSFENLPRNEQMRVLATATRRYQQLKMPDSVDERGIAYDAAVASAITPPSVPNAPAYPGSPTIAPPMPQRQQ